MSALKRPSSLRFQLVRFWQAVEEGLGALQGPAAALPEASAGVKIPPPPKGSLSDALQRFKASLSQPMTSTMYITGTQMAPALNKQGLKEDSVELLVIRNLPRPSPRTVFVGDVVAFSSPLAKRDEEHVMVSVA